jgi:ribosome recycling factor
MQITRISPVSGIARSLEIPCTEEQMAAYKNGALIQVAFPNLTADQREFILTGITKEEWDELFKETDDSKGETDEPAF